MDKPSKEPQAPFSSQAACEAAKVLGILAGFGLLPLLRGRFPEHLWVAGLAAGGLALAAGLYHAWRCRPAPLVPAGWADFSLQFQVVLVGLCLLLSALVAFGLRQQAGLESGLLPIYLSQPAILVWIAGEVLFARPLIHIRPKHAAEFTGLFARGLQILGAVLLWIFLGLSVGTGSLSWLLWAAAGLAGTGLLLALANDTSVATAVTTASSGESKPEASTLGENLL